MLKMWSYDLAREQAPALEHLRRICQVSLDGGYDALGLYLEHRFAYPSISWATAKDAVTPEMIRTLLNEFPTLQLIPMINVLGHMEGFIYTESGVLLAEEKFSGLQACPCFSQTVELAHKMIDDVIDIFDSEIVHIGGDETKALGVCPRCGSGMRSKAEIYGDYFGPLAKRVIEKARRPAIWGDMLLSHPEAAGTLPKETLVFDWNYFSSPAQSVTNLQSMDFEVVCCPALLTYNASWMHLSESSENLEQHLEAAQKRSAFGVCVTTWEQGLFGNYESLLPAIKAAGQRMNGGEPLSNESFADAAQWAGLMSSGLRDCGGIFAFDQHRSRLKCRLLLYGNPFLLWLRHREDLCGEPGLEALAVCEKAMQAAPDAPERGVVDFVKGAIEFVRYVEQAHQAYRQELPGLAVASLVPTRQIFDNLSKIARATHLRIGGSKADIERCRRAREHVEKVMLRVKEYGDGSLGYLPSFESITHPEFMPHDQGNWWLINKWGDE